MANMRRLSDYTIIPDLKGIQGRSGPCISRPMTKEESAKYGGPEMRVCKACGENLPLTNKYFSPTRSGNFYNVCKICRAKQRQERKNAVGGGQV